VAPNANKLIEPEPEQLSKSTVSCLAPPLSAQEAAEPWKPGLPSRLPELGVRHLHAPFPSQNLLLPQDVLIEAFVPPPHEPLG
jgi:hypothetical protein